ncbi:universal stress protein [Chitinophaga qingshengii]|uniref:Universal stress protein n=1 Tax=Chitinophaga qingshengii TaxID=1569794 RepID=A0ABR7TG97_9BACT|nr:universal stress protein [Chitinophaga qingshengii]MBC9929437.1 universal stress protein [Chitinophaga qingshengii]
MEKILFITDAVCMSKSCLDFACYLGNLTHSRLTGVFLENQEMELRSVDEIREKGVIAPVPGARIEQQKELYRDENIKRFSDHCENSGVNCVIHQHTGIPLTAVLRESRYADLLVVDGSTSFSWRRESTPTSFVEEILEKAECPVFIAPENFEGIDEIIFTYNGSHAAMYAIKQFTYLLPQLFGVKATLLSVTPKGQPIKGDREKLEEWLHMHYVDSSLEILEDNNVQATLMEYLFMKEKVMIVMGAFGRNQLSNLFVPNPMKPVVKLVSQPVFVAHH